jgi:hypothetical protein
MMHPDTTELVRAAWDTGSAESAPSLRGDHVRRVSSATCCRPGVLLFELAEPERRRSFLPAQPLRRLIAAARLSPIETRLYTETLPGCHTPVEDGCVHVRL